MTIYRLNLFLIFFWTFTTSSCNNPFFEPLFKVPIDTVNSDIQKIIKTAGIYIEGHKTPIDDKVITSLTIQLINAQNTDISKDSLIKVQEQVASKVKGRLKKPLQYEQYYIIFIKRDSTSEKGFFPHIFKAREL